MGVALEQKYIQDDTPFTIRLRGAKKNPAGSIAGQAKCHYLALSGRCGNQHYDHH
ncbi:hypothetical protein [Citrobacter rodentium]|uniref:Uncharacterized protein n=1 Tax=Citrobacter rodentium (strain ICC168) TaxID=637910 RepID=D2TUG2_CITRI|nr:hypothetical protein [Citrobacter rodentium]UHO30255.1 hypothetical protein K7R23_20070 [Citrobacter rodentium NBRC 105723 = DSM 16636]CBG88015.1 hypothetical protein ROD_12521 [Citrobacter rodentium ICC168]